MKNLRSKIVINVLFGMITLVMLVSVAASSFRPDLPQQSPYCTCEGANSCGPGEDCRIGGCVPYNGAFGKCVSLR